MSRTNPQPAWKRIRVVVDVDVKVVDEYGNLFVDEAEHNAQSMVAVMLGTGGISRTYQHGYLVMHEPRVELGENDYHIRRN